VAGVLAVAVAAAIAAMALAILAIRKQERGYETAESS
jgi:hypothetical protein